jgi:hypothetical protein
MEKTFYYYLNGKRPITIRVSYDYITFHYKNEREREFYSIPLNEWISDKSNRQGRDDNWHAHMMRKTWFNQEMKDFINGKS